MKGVSVLIAFVLVAVITIAGITLVIQSTTPTIDRTNELLLLEEGKSLMSKIDNSIRDVSREAEGSTRILDLSITGGEYTVDDGNDIIKFRMESPSGVISPGVWTEEGNLNITGYDGYVEVVLEYTSVDILNSSSFGGGQRKITVKNLDWDDIEKKQMLEIEVS